MEAYWLEVVNVYNVSRNHVNTRLEDCEAFEILSITFITTFVLAYFLFYIKRHRAKGAAQRLKEWTFRTIRRLPIIKDKIRQELYKINNEIEVQMFDDMDGSPFLQQLPKDGQSKEDILTKVAAYQNMGNIDWQSGRVSGTVYKREDPNLRQLVSDVYHSMAWTNPLHPDVFPGVRKMEAEIVRMVCNLYNGDEKTCGTVTTGGTESIFMACKTYRDYAIAENGIEHPEMIVPLSAHAAFDKAAQLLQVKVVHVPLDPKTMAVNMKAMKAAINKNTCMLVGSSPNYPHGIIDPIQEISNLGLRYRIPVHVDACLGGFLVPFMKTAGFSIPDFDFSVAGVTSISCDTHKYGYAPKGTSVIMYRSKRYLHYQYSVLADWPGGIYATPTLAGSRAGGTIGTCWSSLLYYGFDNYVESTKKIIEKTRFIEKSLRSIPELFIFGQPQVSIVAVGSHLFDIYRLSHALSGLGWNLNPIQFPPGFHICVTQLHTEPGVAENLVRDIQECTKLIMDDPTAPATGRAAIYGMAQSVPDRTFVSEIAFSFLDAYYNTKDPKDENSTDFKKNS